MAIFRISKMKKKKIDTLHINECYGSFVFVRSWKIIVFIRSQTQKHSGFFKTLTQPQKNLLQSPNDCNVMRMKMFKRPQFTRINITMGMKN